MADTTAEQHSVSYYIQKIKQGDAAVWDKDELLDVIYWWRQAIGIVFGVLWGFGQITGILGVIMFFGVNILVTVGLYKSLLGVDEEDFGGHQELSLEGLPSCFASFVISWILTYTALHT